jgi:hypothetical protein
MSPEVILVDAPPMSGGANEPEIQAGRGLRVAYRAASDMFEEKWVVVEFASYRKYCFGHPNEEVIHGHPLYRYGLQFYSVHEVRNSPWIQEIKKLNSVHSRHSDALFESDRHWIFTFQDETLEVISAVVPAYSVVEAGTAAEALSKSEGK